MFEMKEVLIRFNKLLESEKERTIKNQFEQFVMRSLPNRGPPDNSIYTDFRSVIDVINGDANPSGIIVGEIMNSAFVDYVISFKSNAREKELQKLTLDLSDFIYKVGHGDKTPNQIKFSRYLRLSAKNIDPRKDKSPKESMNAAWKRELSADLMRRFK